MGGGEVEGKMRRREREKERKREKEKGVQGVHVTRHPSEKASSTIIP